MKLLTLAILVTSTFVYAENYVLGPDSQIQSAVPKGSVTRYELKAGRFYPGTPHSYSVYVPAQYNAANPAPFMIFLDGDIFLTDKMRVPVVFDNLIAKHDLPPMIGIFVDPGTLPALSDQAQNRVERIFEYDSLSDRYSRFLLEDLIPEVAKQYNLSKNPDDRALCGLSTGAVGSLMAAWNRPDQFRRVLSFIGTYVAMKGADALPALIRRTEAKPIRIFLQDGKNDHIVPAEPYGTFFAGSWPINNQVMFEALAFAGYDAKLVMGDGGHDIEQAGAIMPDALRWLWRGYPDPIVVHEPPAMSQPGWDFRGKVYSVVSTDKPWQQVGDSYSSVAGPTADNNGNVFFSDPVANRIYKAEADGRVSLFKEHSAGAKALRTGPDGMLYDPNPLRGQIVAYAPGGDETVIARNVQADDIAVTVHGTLYFADSLHRTIGYIDTKRQVRIVYQRRRNWSPIGTGSFPGPGHAHRRRWAGQIRLVISDLA